MSHTLHANSPSSTPDWHTSSHSGGQGNCVEVATNLAHAVPVRDTKHAGDGPTLRFPHTSWGAFLGTLI